MGTELDGPAALSDPDGCRSIPVLVGSTGDLYNGTIADTRYVKTALDPLKAGPIRADGWHAEAEKNHFKSAQWSADGTTILTSSADNVLKTFILPPDLLSASTPHSLHPYSTHRLPCSAYASAIYPAFNLLNPATALYIASPSSLPIRLISPFIPGILASYPLINQTTESYIAPHSLLFDCYGSNGNHFLAGSNCEVSIFDINRNGEGPISRMKTIPSRRNRLVGGGIGIKGIVSALSMNSEGILSAGTYGRWVGLYGSGGRGEMGSVFEVGKGRDGGDGVGEGGGITQLFWSQCGNYLCVVERSSDGTGVWDIRNTGQRISWLRGRKAMTQQRLGAEVVGDEVWCGGMDGVVRIWDRLGKQEGVQDPAWEFMGHNDAISSTVMHPSRTVLATCSGQRHYMDMHLDDEGERGDKLEGISWGGNSIANYDNRLSVWAL